MRKIIVVLSIVMLFILQACSVSEGETRVSILNAPTSLDPGETFQLELDVNNPSGLRIHFQTSDRSVLIVDDNGLVYGVSEGTAFITASIGGVVSEPVTSSVSPVLGDTIFDLINNLSYPFIREEVIAARGAYDALNDLEKLKVTNLIELEDAESFFEEIDEAIEAIASLTYPYVFVDFYDAADLFYDLSSNQKVFITNQNVLFNAEAYFYEIEVVFFEINQLPSSLDEMTVTYVRSLYDELALSQKEQVTNYQDLLDAEALLEVFKKALEVQNMIVALEEPYIEAEVTAAREAYNALTDEQKNAVNNVLDLVAAEARLEDIFQANIVEVFIASLNAPYDFNDVEEARNQYDDLTTDQKLLVTNLALLEAAEQELLNMEAALVVVNLIETLVEPYDKSLVTNVRAAYDNLTTNEKAYVTNLSKLENAEQMLLDIAAANLVITEINNLSTDPVDGETVELARASYNALTDAQKQLVTNLNDLVTLESTLEDISLAAAFDQQVNQIEMLRRSSYLSASTSVEATKYGEDVHIEGRYIIVGAPTDTQSVSASGLVYVYDQEDSTYLRVIEASDAKANAMFGQSVSASGDYIVVGATFAGNNSSGQVYVYKFSDITYERIIQSFDGTTGDKFGHDVAIDGDDILIGAPYDDDIGTQSGSIYQYRISNETYFRKIIASDGGFENYFGWKVDILGDYFAVSAYGARVNNLSFAGAVYVFDRDTGLELQKLVSDTLGSNQFGKDISLTQTHLIVGADYDSEVALNAGAVHVYELSDMGLIRKITAFDGGKIDRFGFSVTSYDDFIVIGAIGDDDVATNAGSMYIYRISDPSYVLKLSIESGNINDAFGYGVHMDDKNIVASVPGVTSDGSIHVYDLNYEQSILSARTSYNNLTSNQQALVTSLDALIDHENTLEDIQSFQTLVKPIIDAGLPENLLPDQSLVLDPAKTAFNNLSKELQLLLNQEDVRALYEATSYFDEVESVINKIEGNIFNDVTLRLETRAMYEALDDIQKSLVTNYERLMDAEKLLSTDFSEKNLLISTGISNIIQIEAVDLNFDGNIDFVFATQNTLGVMMNTGTSFNVTTIDTFTSGNDYTFGLIDIDNGFLKDIVLQDPDSANFLVYNNLGNGTFSKNYNLGGIIGDSKALKVVDLNRDGLDDVIYISSQLNVIRYAQSNGNGTFSLSTISASLDFEIVDIDVVDINGNGFLDIVAIASNNSIIRLFLNDGFQTFTIKDISTSIDFMNQVVAGDFNGDGFVDIFIAHKASTSSTGLLDYTKLFKNNGELEFTMESISGLGHKIGTLIAGDLEGDGELDIIFSELRNPSNTNFVLGVNMMVQTLGDLGYDGLYVSETSTVFMYDYNGDLLNDIIYVTPDGKVYVAINNYVKAITND